MSVKCKEPIDELTAQVWLLYHHQNSKYCTLFVSGTELRTDRQTDKQTNGWTDDLITRCPRPGAGGIKRNLSCNVAKCWNWGIVLSGDVVFAKIVLVDNLFTAWALTENIFPAIPRHEYIFIFKSSVCSLQQYFVSYQKERTRGYSPESVLLILKLYYTPVQNRVLVYSSTLAFTSFI